MSIQWTLVASFLYIEIVIIIIFLLPIIKPTSWRKFFQSRFIKSLAAQSHIYLYIFISILCLFFVDSIRETYKYSHKVTMEDRLYVGSKIFHEDQMRQFRAQRNLYICGFALFCLFIIKRLATLLSNQALLEVEVQASLRQARNAAELASSQLSNDGDIGSGGDSILSKQNDELKAEVKKYKKEIKKLEIDLSAMKKQAESTNAAFDELSKKLADTENKASNETRKDK